MSREEPLEKFMREKGQEVLAALNAKDLPDTAKLARVAVIGLKWFAEGALAELKKPDTGGPGLR